MHCSRCTSYTLIFVGGQALLVQQSRCCLVFKACPWPLCSTSSTRSCAHVVLEHFEFPRPCSNHDLQVVLSPFSNDLYNIRRTRSGVPLTSTKQDRKKMIKNKKRFVVIFTCNNSLTRTHGSEITKNFNSSLKRTRLQLKHSQFALSKPINHSQITNIHNLS